MSKSASYEQLAMYMTGPEIKKNYAPGPGERYGREEGDGVESVQEMWDRKLRESQGKTKYVNDLRGHGSAVEELEDNIARVGIRTPVLLGHNSAGAKRIYNGHHRIAVAVANHPNMLIPVEHHD